jgi:hypothetical protein
MSFHGLPVDPDFYIMSLALVQVLPRLKTSTVVQCIISMVSSGSWFLITFITFRMLARLETSSVVQSVICHGLQVDSGS